MNYALLVPIRTKENGKKAGEEGEEADGSKASPVWESIDFTDSLLSTCVALAPLSTPRARWKIFGSSLCVVFFYPFGGCF